MKKIIFFELNEVPWRVIQDFSDKFPNSSLTKVISRCRRFETMAEDSELSPWVTWPSVHRGVADKDHNISNFGQGLVKTNNEFPPIWEILADSGLPTGVFGSLHTHPLPNELDNYCFYIPDVFAAGSECFPDKVRPYQDWNLKMSRDSVRNVSSRIPVRETAQFLGSLPGLGVQPSTLAGIGIHLVSERLENWKKVRRRSQQVVLAFDVFMKQLNRTKPAFSTFFTNHVASSMHRYWAAKYPGDYEQFGYSNDWQDTYHNEIDWTMGKFDQMLGRLLQFVETERDYELWVASSMGQAATTAEKPAKSQTYLSDLSQFMSYLGFGSDDYLIKPAMAPRHIVKIQDKKRYSEFAERTHDLVVAYVDKQCLAPGENTSVNVKNLENGVFMIRAPVIQNHTREILQVDGKDVEFRVLGFSNDKISDQTAQTAYHIPEGSLLIYAPDSDHTDLVSQTISSLDIAPSILQNFGVKVPGYMTGTAIHG